MTVDAALVSLEVGMRKWVGVGMRVGVVPEGIIGCLSQGADGRK